MAIDNARMAIVGRTARVCLKVALLVYWPGKAAMFDFDIRLHLCLHCGAPLEVPVAGGVVRCSYCEADMTVTPRRVHARVLAPPTPLDDPAERTRLAALWKQWREYDDSSNKYSLDNPPEGIEIDGFDVSARTRDFLESELRRLVLLPPNQRGQGTDRRLFWITQRLANLWSMTGEHVRTHATLETASETLSDPGFRQIVYQDLAASALAQRNQEAGHTWLAQCDQAPTDLTIDTGFRLTVARLYHVRGEWRSVLDVIGQNQYQVPIEPSSMPTIALTRSGTLEALGLEAAAETEMMGAIKFVAESTMDANAHMSHEELRDEVHRRAVNWVANSLGNASTGDRHSTYANCLDVWARLKQRGHLPPQPSAAREFVRENG